MASVSTHVLDAVSGTPASGVGVTLTAADGTQITATATDQDGRIARVADDLDVGVYRIRFDTDAWFAAANVDAFYPEIVITFRIVDAGRHHHVPVLLSPFAFSTYRGS